MTVSAYADRTDSVVIRHPRGKDEIGPDKREYRYSVTFTPEGRAQTLRGYVCVAVPFVLYESFWDRLLDAKVLNYFHIDGKTIDTKGQHFLGTFGIRKTHLTSGEILVGGEALAALRAMLCALSSLSAIPIIWKEDDFGYEINMWGKIIRKWELLPF